MGRCVFRFGFLNLGLVMPAKGSETRTTGTYRVPKTGFTGDPGPKRNPPATTSWWVGKSPSEFYRLAKQRQKDLDESSETRFDKSRG